jgi:DNA-binding transcriptional LysR family regulator
MLYDTVLLRTFVAICDSGSFTKAAREVNLTQSAVSLHVKRLEEQVGSRLIVRGARGVRLTEQGEVLLSYARRILALYKEAEQRLGRDTGGLIRIGVPEYFDLHTLSSLLAQFSGRYPAVKIQIELGLGPDISALVDEGELDLAIVSNEIREGDGVPLCRERRVWAAGRTMQLRADEPAPLALYPPFCRWRQLALEELDRAGRGWKLVIQSAGTAGIVAARCRPRDLGLPRIQPAEHPEISWCRRGPAAAARFRICAAAQPERFACGGPSRRDDHQFLPALDRAQAGNRPELQRALASPPAHHPRGVVADRQADGPTRGIRTNAHTR